MPEELIIKECKRCGAPLTHVENEMVCEYCGARYELPKNFRQNVPTPNPITPVHEQSNFAYEPARKPRKSKAIGYIVFLLFVVVLGSVLLVGKSSIFTSQAGDTNGKNNPNALAELSMYRRNSSALPDQNPADFIHEKTFSYGVIYNGGDDKAFNLHILVENHQDFVIDQNIKADNMQLESEAVSDNTSLIYSCEVTDTSSQDLEPNQAVSLAYLRCQPILSPEVKFITVNIAFTNWGQREFQIPINIDMEKLNVRYKIERWSDLASLEISFYADEPQPVGLYFKDISLLDGKGTPIQIEACKAGSTLFGPAGDYFSTLAQSYNHAADINCTIPQSIDGDINAITLVMTIRGKTVSLTTPVDTISDTILYDTTD